MLLQCSIILLFKACNMNNIVVNYSVFSLKNRSIPVGHAEFCMMKNKCTCTKCNTELHKKYRDVSQIVQLFCFYKLCLLFFSIMGWILFALNWYFLYDGIHQSETLLHKDMYSKVVRPRSFTDFFFLPQMRFPYIWMSYSFYDIPDLSP